MLLLAGALGLTLVVVLTFLAGGGGGRPLGVAAGLLLIVLLALALRRMEADRRRIARLAAVHEALVAGGTAPPSGETGVDGVARIGRSLDRLAERLGAGGRQPADRLGLHDPLTGLPGRRLLQELLHKQVAQARRSGELVGLIVCDLDDFKAINESYGHGCGDRLLQAVAGRLTADIREADAIARTGGDEFTVVVCRAETPEDIERVAARLLAGLRTPIPVDDRQLLVSMSAGVGMFPRHGADAERLLDNAETALATAKGEGGNTIRIYSEALGRWPRERAALGQELRLALRENRLRLYFQPQVALADGRLVGMEALVRWPHPERGLVPAGVFIPVAEETGLMPELGRWLIGEVCRQNAAWHGAGLARLPVSVNVSGRQFQGEGDVAGMVEGALATSGLAARWLHLEITESIALDDFERISEALLRLRQRGVKIHLDDFGTGYSSLSYLLRFPVDVLKIDRSFVAGVPASRHGASIVHATLSLAASLGLEVIAEGVEEPGQLRFLEAAGCAVVQGFLVGRPAPVEQFEELLARGRVDLESLLSQPAGRR